MVTPKRAVDEAVQDQSTAAYGKRRALPMVEELLDKSTAVVEDDPPTAQEMTDRALATFIAAHKLDSSIFASVEWDELLTAANQAPLLPLSMCYEDTPAVLLLRAGIHQQQAALSSSSL